MNKLQLLLGLENRLFRLSEVKVNTKVSILEKETDQRKSDALMRGMMDKSVSIDKS
jgi:hypothetical protein